MCLTVVPVSPRKRLARLLPVLLLSGLIPVLGTVGASPAAATSTYLCSGYSSCAAKGYSSSGYAGVNNKMYWRMYSGHNCTNYVAYRMIKAGMSSERPWSGGSGNAYYWGYAMKSITDQTPQVGAVAWYDRGVPGAGSAGHVAYVEKVVSSTEIIVSEDSWGGDFDWRIIRKDGPGWPTGFIHFVDRITKNTTPPRVVGTSRVGETLTARHGVWTPGGPTKAYQWLAGGVPIAGATTDKLVLGPELLGAAVSVRVTATKPGFAAAVADSPALPPVSAGVLTSTAPPTFTGTPQVGTELTAVRGAWTPRPEIAALRWKADGRVIPGQSGPTLTLTKDLVGATITLGEIARRDGFVKGSVAAAGSIGPVVEGVVEMTAPFVASGVNRYGGRIGVTPGTVTPSDATVGYAWLRDDVPVPGATAPIYDVGGADVGHDLTLRVTASKPRYRAAVSDIDFATTTTTTATTIKVKTTRKRMVIVKARIRAAGVGPVDGRVTLDVGVHHVEGTAVHGYARLVLRDLNPGWRRVKVSYGGDAVRKHSGARLRVKVKR